jgi:hypothetical protein
MGAMYDLHKNAHKVQDIVNSESSVKTIEEQPNTHNNDQKDPLIPEKTSLMIVQYGGVVSSTNNRNLNSNRNNHNSNLSKEKDGTINATKAVVKRSILMQITARAKVASGFH